MMRVASTQRTIVCLVVVGIVLVADRVCKLIALEVWSQRPVRLLPEVELTFLLNRGIAFGLPALPVLQGAIITALVVLFVAGVRAIRRHNTRVATGALVILMGAASNMADRMLYGGVVDYLHIALPSVINLADVLIVLGCLLLATAKETKRTMQETPQGSGAA